MYIKQCKNYFFEHLQAPACFGHQTLSPMQTDATMLDNNSHHFWMLHVVSVCTLCCVLLCAVRSCCAKFETGQTFEPTHPTFLLFRDRVAWSVAQQCWIRLHSSSNIVGATHAHYTCVLQSLMGCFLPIMHRRCQHYWELLHLFAPHCQHALNNTQHCWSSYVWRCCVRLHLA